MKKREFNKLIQYYTKNKNKSVLEGIYKISLKKDKYILPDCKTKKYYINKNNIIEYSGELKPYGGYFNNILTLNGRGDQMIFPKTGITTDSNVIPEIYDIIEVYDPKNNLVGTSCIANIYGNISGNFITLFKPIPFNQNYNYCFFKMKYKNNDSFHSSDLYPFKYLNLEIDQDNYKKYKIRNIISIA